MHNQLTPNPARMSNVSGEVQQEKKEQHQQLVGNLRTTNAKLEVKKAKVSLHHQTKEQTRQKERQKLTEAKIEQSNCETSAELELGELEKANLTKPLSKANPLPKFGGSLSMAVYDYGDELGIASAYSNTSASLSRTSNGTSISENQCHIAVDRAHSTEKAEIGQTQNIFSAIFSASVFPIIAGLAILYFLKFKKHKD